MSVSKKINVGVAVAICRPRISSDSAVVFEYMSGDKGGDPKTSDVMCPWRRDRELIPLHMLFGISPIMRVS